MAVNIDIEREGQTYFITMGGNHDYISSKIMYTWAQTQTEAREWVSQIQKIHKNKNNKKQPLVVGLCALRKVDYSDGQAQLYLKPKQVKWYKQNAPYDLIILCVGSQCLLWEIELCLKQWHNLKEGYKPCEQPKFLKDLLSNDRAIVVGLGMYKVVKRLQTDTDLLIHNQVEMRDFMEEKLGGEFAKIDIGKLSKLLLGPEMEVVKPRNILWKK